MADKEKEKTSVGSLVANASPRDDLTRTSDKGLEVHVTANVLANEKQQAVDDKTKRDSVNCNPMPPRSNCTVPSMDGTNPKNTVKTASMAPEHHSDSNAMKSEQSQSVASGNLAQAKIDEPSPITKNEDSSYQRKAGDNSSKKVLPQTEVAINPLMVGNPNNNTVVETSSIPAMVNGTHSSARIQNPVSTTIHVQESSTSIQMKGSKPDLQVASMSGSANTESVKTAESKDIGNSNPSVSASTKASGLTTPTKDAKEANNSADSKSSSPFSANNRNSDHHALKTSGPTPTKNFHPASASNN